MVLCNVGCVQKISEYLEAPSYNIYLSEDNVVASDNILKNQTIHGFSTIVQALVKESKKLDLLGKDGVELALVKQWLEYTVLYLNYADLPANSRRVLKELNVALLKNTYICGTSQTIADIVLYYVLHSIMKGLTHQEKAEYVNVSRWFDNVQQHFVIRYEEHSKKLLLNSDREELLKKLDLINFDLLYLYL